MPYIPKDERYLFELDLPVGASPGQINYAITHMLDSWLGKNMSYDRINDIIGVLECIKLEMYRRVAVPYESWKQNLNGDAYTERHYH